MKRYNKWMSDRLATPVMNQFQLAKLVLLLEKWKKSQLFHNSPWKEGEVSTLEKEKMWSKSSLR